VISRVRKTVIYEQLWRIRRGTRNVQEINTFFVIKLFLVKIGQGESMDSDSSASVTLQSEKIRPLFPLDKGVPLLQFQL
jgi:hypothetical protein